MALDSTEKKPSVSADEGSVFSTVRNLWSYMWPENRPDLRMRVVMALAALSFLTPIIDRVLPADRFQWGKPSKSKEGRIHETQTPGRSGDARPQLARL